MKTTYETLAKPAWAPPSYVFGPVWTVLYGCMGYASYEVWRQGHDVPALYWVQLSLNLMWTPIFFGLGSLRGACLVITALLGAVIATTVNFWRVSKLAGALMVPYCVWTGFATALNISIVFLNLQPTVADKSKHTNTMGVISVDTGTPDELIL